MTRTRHRAPETSQNLPSRSSLAKIPVHLGHRQARPLQVLQRDPRRSSPIIWSCAQGKCVPVSAFSYLALDSEETRALNAAYHQCMPAEDTFESLAVD
jgi:hypothetical protein